LKVHTYTRVRIFEEVLRLDSSVIAWRRRTTQAVDVGGVAIPGSSDLLLLIGSANRDPSVFPELDRLDIRRANAQDHLSFGAGPHLCLGAPLARLQARSVLEEVPTRLPSLFWSLTSSFDSRRTSRSGVRSRFPAEWDAQALPG
jgi:cytochrome P450